MFKVGDRITNNLVGWQADITSETDDEFEIIVVTGPYAGDKFFQHKLYILTTATLTTQPPTEEQLENEKVHVDYLRRTGELNDTTKQ